MSIIQEALKKAERHIKDPKKAAPSAEALPPVSSDQSSVKAPRPAAGSDPKAVAILIVILIATAVFAASQLFPKKNIPAKSSVATTPAVPAKIEEPLALPSVIFQQAAAQQPEEKKLSSPEFVLNGIMYLEGSPRAIINDVMVEVGDTVGGASVVKIEKKNVLLQYNDADIVLDLK
jgi:hypothetical protein